MRRGHDKKRQKQEGVRNERGADGLWDVGKTDDGIVRGEGGA